MVPRSFSPPRRRSASHHSLLKPGGLALKPLPAAPPHAPWTRQYQTFRRRTVPLSRTLDWGDMRVPGCPGRGSFSGTRPALAFAKSAKRKFRCNSPDQRK